MKKIVLLAISAMSAFTLSFGQGGEYSKFQFTFIPPLGTNGVRAAQYTNGASINLLVGLSRNEEALSLAGLMNIVTNDIKGVQLAGFGTYAGGTGRGFMASGLFNYVGGNYRGWQMGGFVNIASGFSGAQIAGFLNLSAGAPSGVQLAGFLNTAGDVRSQLAGFVNVAGRVSGIQLAGLLNIAQQSRYPIAILNFIRDGEKYLGASYDGLGNALISFRSGSRVTYGILGAGYNFRVDEIDYVVEAGFGANINILPWLRIRNELKATSMSDLKNGTVAFTGGYHLMPALRLGRFELFGGPSISYINSEKVTLEKLFSDNPLWEERKPDKVQQLYLGWQAGVNFRF